MSTCKDCIHNKICGHYVKSLSKSKGIDFDNAIEQYCEISECDNCEYFQNRSKFIELPCKVGDTYYYVQQQCTERGWYQNFIDTGLSNCEYCNGHEICDKRYIIKEKRFNTLTQIVEYYEKYILSHKLDKYRKMFHIKEEAKQALRSVSKND